MKNVFFSFFLLSSFFLSLTSFAYVPPDSSLTPGLLCTSDDPNFDKYDYSENIARCKRNISTNEKSSVAANYGDIPRDEWPNYEFDHLIPLCAGGSNDPSNLWPQPLSEAHTKDVLEDEICREMRNGTITQEEGVTKIHDWFNAIAIDQHSYPSYKSIVHCKDQSGHYNTQFFIMGLQQIANIAVNIRDPKSESKIIKIQNLIKGTNLHHTHEALLKDSVQYKLQKKSNSSVELFLPAEFVDEEAIFTAYLKIELKNHGTQSVQLSCK